MQNASLKSAALAIYCGLFLLSNSSHAQPIGNLKSLKATETAVHISTDQQAQIKFSLITPQVFRLEAHLAGVQPEANNTDAPIVLTQAKQPLDFRLEENTEYYLEAVDLCLNFIQQCIGSQTMTKANATLLA